MATQNVAAAVHSARHATGGPDAIAPAAIGAAPLPAATEMDLYVSVGSKASDSNDGLTPGSPKATIAAAVAALGTAPGTIWLLAGTHYITAVDAHGNGVTLTSQGQNIRGRGVVTTTIVINVSCTWGIQCQAQQCSVSDAFVIIGAGMSVTYGVGVSTASSVGSAHGCIFSHIFVNVQGTSTAAFALGPDWPGSSSVDVAGNRFDNCTYNGTPVNGWLIGNGTSGNVLQNMATNCIGAGAQHFCTLAGGSLSFYGGGGSDHTVSDFVVIHTPGEPISINHWRGENGKRFLDVGYIGQTRGINLTDCLVGNYSPADDIIISYNAIGTLRIESGSYDSGPATKIVMNSSGPSSTLSQLIATGVTLFNSTGEGWPAYNPSSYLRTIIAAGYGVTSAVPLPNPRYTLVLDGLQGTVNTVREVAHSAAATLTADNLDVMHACALTSAAWTLTLPSPIGAGGRQVGVRVTGSSTKLLTLATVAGTIDGSATRIMWAGEAATLESDGTDWVKIGGRTIPMTCAYQSTTSTPIPNGAVTTVPLDNMQLDNTGLMASSSTIVVRRPGQYQVAPRIGMVVASANASRCIILVKNNGAPLVQAETNAVAGQNLCHTIVDQVALTAGDVLTMQFYQTSGVSWSTVSGLAPNGTCLKATEIPTW